MAEGSEAKDAVEREHELNRKWTLWFSPATAFGKGGGWTQALEQIYTFGTVEDFWRLFNNVQSMSKLPPGSKYNYFQDGVQPAWEDPVNKDGGHWEFETTFTEADEFWMKTILLTIGEDFEESEYVVGLNAGSKKNSVKISIWVKDTEEEHCMKIAQYFKSNLGLSKKMSFVTHGAALKTSKPLKTSGAKYEL